jgi:hypothetical protein
MDLAAFAQENKRWLVGVAIGGIVYLVASAVIASVYSADGPLVEARKLVRQAGTTPLYDGAALNAARDEADLLKAERQRSTSSTARAPPTSTCSRSVVR